MNDMNLDKLLVTKETFIKQVYDLEHIEIDLNLPDDFYLRAYLYKKPLMACYRLDDDKLAEKITNGLNCRIIACLKGITVFVMK